MATDEATGHEDREFLIALDGYVAGKTMREIVEDLFGAQRVAAEWATDSVVPARMRRLVRNARAYRERG